ncbi:neural proliferation differentiation and control protein 1 [Pseudophryne corroboree]|uniref:neural proliferation differentiation and control protein 1 n=1 Tax=Pseudophryne corroboree TaxID=495146 RepID=UPI003081FE49
MKWFRAVELLHIGRIVSFVARLMPYEYGLDFQFQFMHENVSGCSRHNVANVFFLYPVKPVGLWTNPSASDQVLEAVASTLQSYPFSFRGAKILSGQDEGLFCWVTANYLLEKFNQAVVCPNILDCPLHRREVCPPGSSECGPCIFGYRETADGKCVRAVQDRGPESEIDYMAAKLAVNRPPIYELAQVNSTPSQAPPPPNPPAGRSNTPGAPRESKRPNDAVLLGVFVGCAAAGLLALLAAGICWCRMRKEMKLTEKTDYPAFKQSPPPPYDKTPPGDKKLAQNAQMYHYQHQKQQMISMEKNKDELKHPDSAVTSDEENEDGDFTVYECPGLAPTGEMEVKNPLFDDSSLHHSAHHPH